MFIKSAKTMNRIAEGAEFRKIINEIKTSAKTGSFSLTLFSYQTLTPKQIKMLTRKGYNVTKQPGTNYVISWE